MTVTCNAREDKRAGIFDFCPYDEKKHMIEVLPEAAGETSLLGNIYVGKVENIVTNLNAAFVKIAPDIRCYLPLSDVKIPFFTRKLSQTKALGGGR